MKRIDDTTVELRYSEKVMHRYFHRLLDEGLGIDDALARCHDQATYYGLVYSDEFWAWLA